MPRSANGAISAAPRFHDQGASVRIPFVHGCLLTTPVRVRGGLVCNISVQGVYVTLDEPLPDRGDEVHVSVKLPGQEAVLEADTIVTWQNRTPSKSPDSLPPGVGLRFQSLLPAYQERVVSLVRDHGDRQVGSDLVLPNMPHAGPKRVPYIQPCRFTYKGESIDTIICNLSRLGAYVKTSQMPGLGDVVRLSFETQRDAPPLDLKAVVAWLNPEDQSQLDPLAPGCGVRFLSLGADNEGRLRLLIESLGASPPVST